MTSSDAERTEPPRRTRFREPAAAGADAPTTSLDKEPAQAASPPPAAPAPAAARSAATTPATPPARRGALVIAACVVAVLSLAAAVVFAVMYVNARGDADDLAAARRNALSTAEQTAIDFSSYDYRRLDRDFAAVSARLTPKFRASYGKTAAALKATLTQYQAVGTAKVLDAGLSRLTSGKATVIVFLDQTVTSKTSPTPTVDRNRIRVQLQRSGDRWLVSALDVR